MGVQVFIFAQPQYTDTPFQAYHYRPLPHTRHPNNPSINTIPGNQTQ